MRVEAGGREEEEEDEALGGDREQLSIYLYVPTYASPLLLSSTCLMRSLSRAGVFQDGQHRQVPS